MLRSAAALLTLAVALGCTEQAEPTPDGGRGGAASATGTRAGQSPDADGENVEPASAAPKRRPDERPLPAFEGRTLDGDRLAISSYLGRRLILFFFNPDAPVAGPVADAVAAIAASRGSHNFGIVGVAEGTTSAKAREFVGQHALDIPVIDDTGARIANRLGLRVPVALLGVDDEGYVTFGMGGFPEADPDGARSMVESRLRESLRIPAETTSGELLARPQAPDFTGTRLGGGTLALADLRGRPVVLIFFLSTCPHCHNALAFLKDELPKLPEATRPVVVGVEVSRRSSGVRTNLAKEGLEFFDVVIDADGSIGDAYGVFGGVPVLVLLDDQGRIVHRNRAGWDDQRDPALLRMRLAKLAGTPVPMLLDPKGYTGSDVCGVCHEVEYATWEFTQHAGAYDTLVTHGASRDGECVSCHVVGYDQPGGFTLSAPHPYLEDVGCESCHGRGGPHLSPDFAPAGQYEKACLTCHDQKHSLGFDYATFLPRISHKAIAALSAEERAALVADGRKPREVLPTRADYVGSDACATCHPAEFETWSKSPHAHALASLGAKGKTDDPDCLVCHTTAYGKPGGFPSGASPENHPDLARVGCESCHGPGGDHVGEGAARTGTIVGLADKCDSCVILQICGACHDDANDPGFEFEVQEKIELQRHGTSAKTTTRGGPHAARPVDWMAHGFRQLGAGSGR